MATENNSPAPGEGEKLKIYFLPNLLTAGNLFCGFVALTQIVEANLVPDANGIVAHIGQGAQGGDVVCVFSNGGFDGIHGKLLARLGKK